MKTQTRTPKSKETKNKYNRKGEINYKNIALLKTYMGRRNQILPKKYTKLTTKTQRKLALEIKKARQMGLLKYTERH